MNKFGNDTSSCPTSPTQVVQVIDDPTVSFLSKPNICSAKNNISGGSRDSPAPFLIAVVVSSPKNHHYRTAIRLAIKNHNLKSTRAVQPLFVIGDNGGGHPEHQDKLKDEIAFHQDILQLDTEETYANIAYKVVAGYTWISCFCSEAKFVLKMDDNAVMHYGNLIKHLEAKPTTEDDSTIHCVTSPMRNLRPPRPHPIAGDRSFLGKWAIRADEYDQVFQPDMCWGIGYVTRPNMAIRLAEVAANMPKESYKMIKLEDAFITGLVRERIANSQVEPLAGGLTGALWSKVLSQCPIMSGLKNVFFNDVVLAKNGYIKNLRFAFCSVWEYFWYLYPNSLPQPLIDICIR